MNAIPSVLSAILMASLCPAQKDLAQKDALTLSFHREVTESAPEKDPTTHRSVVTIQLRPTSFDILRDRVLLRHDIANGEIQVMDLDAGVWFPQNLLAAVDFKYAELANRQELTKVLEAASIGDMMMGTPVELESLFGIGRAAADAIEVSTTDSSLTTRSASHELVHCDFAETPVPESLRRTFAQYLFFTGAIHATTREAIVADGRIPSVLRYRAQNSGTIQRVELTLRDASALIIEPDRDAMRCAYSDQERLGAILVQSAALLEDDGLAKSRNALIEQVHAQGAAGKTLDAFLLFLEVSWMQGNADPKIIRGHLGSADAMAQVQPLSRHLGGEPDALLKFLDTLPRDEFTHPHVVDILRANAYSGLKEPRKAIELLLGALEKNPGMAGALKDLGDMWRIVFDMPAAWSCWDMGRKLDPKHPMFRQVERFERDLRKRFDELF